MNRSSALFLSLILICQIMANGLNTTPNQSESENFLYVEDIFQSPGNNSSGNNTGCGNNSTYSTINITMNGQVNKSTHYVKQFIPVVIDISCALFNTSVEVTYGIRSYHNNNLSLTYNFSWYANGTNNTFNRQINPIVSTGYYEIWAELRDSNGSQFDNDSDQIQLINIPSNLLCGNNSALSDVDITINGSFNNSVHYVNQSIPVIIDVSCALMNKSMEITYGIRSYHNNNLSLTYNYSWYTNSANYTFYRQFNPVLSTGYYEVWAQLRDSNGTQIDGDHLLIQIVNQSNNSGGGNTGCGYASWYSNVNVWANNGTGNGTFFYVNQSIPVQIDVSCALLNTSMQVNYGVRNYYSGNILSSSNYSWYANSTNHRINSQFSPLSSTGYYEIWADLRDTNGTQIDSDTLQIQVINQSNNSGGNNSGGGNNTGGNSTTGDAHCLELANVSINQTYYVTLNLVNTCSFSINYPGINASSDNSNVQGLYDGWWYQIGWSNSSYAVQPYSAQLTFNSSIQNGTIVTLDFEATVMNCGQNNSWSHQCPNSNNSSLSIQFQYIEPQPKLVIWSATISSLSSSSDRIALGYYSENYTGYVTWEYTSANGTSTHSSYVSSSYRTTYIYPDTFGTIQICGSIPGDITCTNVTRVIRLLDGYITSPANNYSTHSQSVYVGYFAENFTSGSITLNGGTVDYISPSYHNGSSVWLPYGWSTICLHLSGDNNSTLSDCINVYREPAVVRLVIQSATLSSDNTYVMVRYKAENFSGNVYWSHTGNSSQFSSYASNYLRTTYIYPSTFGTIQICGSVSNYSVTECVSINRTARLVEGDIYPPSDNFTTSNRVYFSYYANNYTYGNLSLNGVTFDGLGPHFDNNNTRNVTQTYRYIPYGHSTICMNLVGEDGTTLSDCFSIERQTPPHFVHIDYPNSGSSFTGYMVNLTYTLGNSSNHYYTVNGATTLPVSNFSNQTTLYVGFGSHTVCVVSFSLSNVMDSDCVNVTMIDPYADSDSDGVIDTSDLCPNTTQGSSVDSDGCAPYQLDSDSDGVTDDLDICPSTQQFSNVDTNGCAAYQRDSDGDGIMDNLDVCPSTPANSVVDSYGCAISQTDSDNDGVMDDVDLCPATFVGSQVNADGCAPSQLDSDSDGVVDSFDQCPNTQVGTVVDQTGCVPTSGGNSSNGSSGGGSSSSGLPSIGIVGTLASIGLGLIVINSRRED